MTSRHVWKGLVAWIVILTSVCVATLGVATSTVFVALPPPQHKISRGVRVG